MLDYTYKLENHSGKPCGMVRTDWIQGLPNASQAYVHTDAHTNHYNEMITRTVQLIGFKVIFVTVRVRHTLYSYLPSLSLTVCFLPHGE